MWMWGVATVAFAQGPTDAIALASLHREPESQGSRYRTFIGAEEVVFPFGAGVATRRLRKRNPLGGRR